METWFNKIFGKEQKPPPADIGKAVPSQPDAARTKLAETGRTVHASTPIDPQAIHAAEAHVAAEWKVGDVILDLYEVKQVHEGGGMGLVYRVHHRGWNMDLAVKSPRTNYFQTEAQKENFTRECETWINLGLHPHIVSCHYVRTLGGIPRVFAEYVEGGSLKEWIESRRLYEGGSQESLKRILDIAIQMAWGLHYSHESRVIHQDVKPANVLMMPDGTAKVTDFGLAKARAVVGKESPSGNQQSILVSNGGMTPAYCSPEQANKQPLSRKTDIWSWGVSVLEMLIGEVCWQSGTAAPELLNSLGELRADGVGIADPPPELLKLLQQCFAAPSDERPENIRVVADRLASIYRTLTRGTYIRDFPEAAENQADTLNNRGLSLLDLPKTELAFKRHLGPVFSVAISADGYYALSGSEDSTLRFWEVQSRRCIGVFAGHTRAVVSVSLSADGRLALSGSTDKTVRLWDTAKGSCSKVLTGHKYAVSAVALSAKGQWALSGSDWLNLDCTIQLWDVANGRCVRPFEGHKGGITSLAFSADGRLALSGSSDRTLRLWEVPSGRCLQTLEGHTGTVAAVALSADGRLAISASHDKSLRLWKSDTGACLKVLEGHTESVDAVALSSDGRFAFSGSRDKTLRLWDVDSGYCVRVIQETRVGVGSVAISGDGRWAFACGPDHQTVWLWDLANPHTDPATFWDESLRLRPGHPEATYNRSVMLWRKGELTDQEVLDLINIVKVTPATNWRKAFLRGLVHLERGDRQASIQELEAALPESNGSLEVRQALEAAFARTEESKWVTAFEGSGSCVAISANEQLAVTNGKDGKLHVWDIGQGRCIMTLEGHADSINAVALSLDGRWALSGSNDKTVRVWDLTRGQCVHTLRGHKTRVNCVAISPDSRLALSAEGDFDDASDTGLRLWDLANGQCVRTMTGHDKAISTIGISPDGRFAVSGGWDGNLYLWDLPSGERRLNLELERLGGLAESVAFSRDGTTLLMGGGIRRLRLYDVKAGLCRRQFNGFTEDPDFVAVSPDARWGVSVGRENTLRIWDLDTGQCIRTLTIDRGAVLSHNCCFGARLLIGTSKGYRFFTWPTNKHPSPYVICRPVKATEELRLSAEFRARVRAASESLSRHEYPHALAELENARQLSGFENAPEIFDLKSSIGRFGCRKNLVRVVFRNRLAGHRRDVVSVVISSDARFGISGSWDMATRLWDLSDGRCLRVFQGHDFDVAAVAVSGCGKYLLTGSGDRTLRQWNIETGACLRIFKGHTRGVRQTAIFPGNRLGISASSDHTLRLWDLSTGNCVRTFYGHTGDVKSVAVGADGRWVISGSWDKTLRLWDVATGQCLRVLTGSENFVNSVCIPRNGYMAVSGGRDGVVRVWDLATGKCAHVLEMHAEVNSVACSADGRWVVSGGGGGTVRLWDVSTERSEVLGGHRETVNTVDMSPDCRWILSGSSDGTSRLWELDWNYEFPEVADWDERASGCLSVFLHLHCEATNDGVRRNGPPRWGERDFQDLLTDLQHRGFGWLRPEGVRRQLERMTSEWKHPPHFVWESKPGEL